MDKNITAGYTYPATVNIDGSDRVLTRKIAEKVYEKALDMHSDKLQDKETRLFTFDTKDPIDLLKKSPYSAVLTNVNIRVDQFPISEIEPLASKLEHRYAMQIFTNTYMEDLYFQAAKIYDTHQKITTANFKYRDSIICWDPIDTSGELDIINFLNSVFMIDVLWSGILGYMRPHNYYIDSITLNHNDLLMQYFNMVTRFLKENSVHNAAKRLLQYPKEQVEELISSTILQTILGWHAYRYFQCDGTDESIDQIVDHIVRKIFIYPDIMGAWSE